MAAHLFIYEPYEEGGRWRVRATSIPHTVDPENRPPGTVVPFPLKFDADTLTALVAMHFYWNDYESRERAVAFVEALVRGFVEDSEPERP
jgi:hypothetical protein